MCMVWRSMLSERVGSMNTHKHYCVQVLSRMLCVRVVLYIEVWKRVCVKWPARKLTYVKVKDGETDKEAQVWGGSLLSLSLQPCSSLRGCLSFSLSHCWHSRSYSYHHHALHCSPPCVHTNASMAWPLYGVAAWASAQSVSVSVQNIRNAVKLKTFCVFEFYRSWILPKLF